MLNQSDLMDVQNWMYLMFLCVNLDRKSSCIRGKFPVPYIPSIWKSKYILKASANASA